MRDQAVSSSPSFAGSVWPPSRDFWQRDFDEATKGGIVPFLFKAVLPPNFPTHEEVAGALREMQRCAQSHEATPARLRFYLDEERHEDLVGKILRAEISTAESLPAFVQRVVGCERFCLVVNNLEVLSDRLAAGFGEFIQSMFPVRGVPIGGCEQVAFAGNYEGTPFGVHEGYEHAFLIHLGPGVKDFYCWSQEDYVRLTGGRKPTFGNYEWLLKQGQKFVLEPGDALYLPALVYHVARLTDFSVSVAIPLYTYPRERVLLRALLPLVTDSLLAKIEGGPSPQEALSYEESPAGSSYGPLADQVMRHLSDHMREHLSALLADRWFRLISNGGWEVSEGHLLLPGTDEALSPPQTIEKDSTIGLRKPFKLCWSELNCPTGELRVFLRGRSVSVPFHGELPGLFRRLNDGEQIALDATEQLLGIFRAVSMTGGLHVRRKSLNGPAD